MIFLFPRWGMDRSLQNAHFYTPVEFKGGIPWRFLQSSDIKFLEESGDGEPLYVDDIQSFVGAGGTVTLVLKLIIADCSWDIRDQKDPRTSGGSDALTHFDCERFGTSGQFLVLGYDDSLKWNSFFSLVYTKMVDFRFTFLKQKVTIEWEISCFLVLLRARRYRCGLWADPSAGLSLCRCDCSIPAGQEYWWLIHRMGWCTISGRIWNTLQVQGYRTGKIVAGLIFPMMWWR